MSNPTISAIAAITKKDRGIGKNNDIPWDIPQDREHFAEVTKDSPVIMGRKTWKSLPDFATPLPERENIVMTRNEGFEVDEDNVTVVHSKDAALEAAKKEGAEEIFIMGGAKIYELFLGVTDKLYITLVEGDFDCDTFFPAFRDAFEKTEEEPHPDHDPSFVFCTLKRKQ